MFKKLYLKNGIPLIMEKTEDVRSVVIGIWVKVGARYEQAEKNGISHFIEHMFFKGTRSRTAEDIAIEIDSVGGDLNAFTSREMTAFYARILDEYIDKGIDLLCDIVTSSVFDIVEIEKEKGVVHEEIRMVEDTPDDYIFDLFNKGIWGDDGLGRPVLGTAEAVGSFTREDIVDYINSFYTAGNTIVACAGNLDIKKTVGLMNDKLSIATGIGDNVRPDVPRFKASVDVYPKDLSEVHMCVGFEGLPGNSPDRYALSVINTLLGSGISSRLFQEIREKRGLVYSIHSFLSSYHDTGCIGIYAGAGEKKFREVIDLIIKNACSLKDTISMDELDRTKNQLKGNIILALESASAKMSNLAKQEIYHGRYFSPEDIIKSIEDVSMEEVRDLSERIFDPEKMAVTLLGPVDEEFSVT